MIIWTGDPLFKNSCLSSRDRCWSYTGLVHASLQCHRAKLPHTHACWLFAGRRRELKLSCWQKIESTTEHIHGCFVNEQLVLSNLLSINFLLQLSSLDCLCFYSQFSQFIHKPDNGKGKFDLNNLSKHLNFGWWNLQEDML